MKAAVYYAPKDIRIENVPRPELEPRDVLLKIMACGICGSDLAGYERGMYISPGQIMGHEFSGEVAEVGKEVKDIAVGERVSGIGISICKQCYWCEKRQYHLCPSLFTQNLAYGRPGAFAEYVKIPKAAVNRNIFKLSNEMSFEEGAFLEPLSVAWFAVNKIQPEPGNSILILGAGMIGLCIASILQRSGGYKVMISEISPKRLAEAQKMGVKTVINPTQEDISQAVKKVAGEGKYHFGMGSMTDIVIDCAGVPQTLNQALQLVRSGGKLLLVGLYEKPVEINPTLIIHKDISIMGCLGGNMKEALSLIEQREIDMNRFVTHRFPLNEIKEAFETQANSSKSIKVVIHPWS